MNYGLYLSASGAVSGLHRQNVVANNLANLHTVGFKPDEVYLRERLPERVEAGAPTDPQLMLEQLGGGLFVEPTITQFEQGILTETGNELDVAIQGDGFFVLRGAAGETRLTRDGRFTLNPRGEVTHIASGMALLDDSDRPIRPDPGADLRIDGHGVVTQDGAALARIRVADVADTANLRKIGENLFAVDPSAKLAPAKNALLQGGHVEASAVDPIRSLQRMIDLSRAVEGNLRMIQYHDSLNDQVINRIGRVA